MTKARGLKLAVTSSCTKGKTAKIGEEIEYTLTILANENTEAQISFTPPRATVLVGSESASLSLGKGEEKKITFKVKVLPEAEGLAFLCGPRVTVNGLEVFTHQVPLGERLTDSEIKALNEKITEKEAESILSAASKAYREIGISTLPTETEYIRKGFFMYDSTSGDLLYRKPQIPTVDGAVYSLFGGTGVTTPENSAFPFIRTAKPRREDFAPGDIIIISNDPYGVNCYSAYYTGTSLIGKFEDSSESVTVREGAEVDEFIDSLLGRFAFLVIRPALTRK
jgi:hypothetical protein